MADKSAIEWTDATWNPVTGCSKVSPGCAHCYAETLALTRLAGKAGYSGLPWTPENAETNVVLRPDRLDLPLRWRGPRRVFVNSMSDLFHERVPDGFIDQVWSVMARAHRHTFQVLTKRPERMRDYLVAADIETAWRLTPAPDGTAWATPNVWIGTSIENDRWTSRADALRETPAAVRFLSLEPLLGPLPSLDLTGIGWVIVGGESGPGFRPVDPGWVRDIRDRAVAAGVPFLFKQWGGIRSKSGGRELDGRTWDEYPEVGA
ncbi:MAG: phage Gp37/Gp68 family protein [Candidatus Moraniibacteriota bacterium]